MTMERREPVKHWSMKTAIEQIQKCGFECEGGRIEFNDAWTWLCRAAERGPEFWPGQGVWYEVEAYTPGGMAIKQWGHFYIVGCCMSSGTDSRFWLYSLSNDPPAPYHYGAVQFSGVSGDQLRLTNPGGIGDGE
ncbi:MAG: hypothetical protein ACOY4R_27420 [Pseudomonadota bacterium]